MNKTLKHNSTAKKTIAHGAITLLIADHKKVKGLFKQFEKLKEGGSAQEKADLAQHICNELRVHAQIEEELFYPAARKAIHADDLMDEAEVEHAGAKELIEQLEAMQPDDDLYDAKVIVLGEQVEHHVSEEEGEMFPKVRRANVDTAVLGAQMLQRKLELQEELGLPDDTEEGTPATRGARKQPARDAERHVRL
jgi:hemerythrin superfamily protein